MIARLLNIDLPKQEIEGSEFDCIRIADSNGRSTFLQREGIPPNEVAQLLESTHGQFAGDYELTIWKKGTKATERNRYIVTATGGKAGGIMNGVPAPQAIGSGVAMSDYLGVLERMTDAKLEVERMRSQIAQPTVDHFREGIGLLRTFIQSRNPQPAGAGRSSIPAREAGTHGTALVNGPEDGPDALDEYLDEEPEALEIITRILELKRRDPATYEQTKGMLANLANDGRA